MTADPQALVPNHPPQAARRRSSGLLSAVLLSLFLHAVMITLLATQFRLHQSASPGDRLNFRLVPMHAPEPEPAATAETVEIPPAEDADQVANEVAALPDPANDPMPAPKEADPVENSSVRIRAHLLRNQVLQRIRRDAPVRRDTDVPTRLLQSPEPRLPGRTGWLHHRVGPVSPHSDTWMSPAGASHGRHVTASGRVICTRRDAPTVEESMQPWKYAAVTRAWDCGQTRPAPPDPSDPWLHNPLIPQAGRVEPEAP